jgi:argininosuccinate lyase
MRKGRFNKPAAEIAQRYGESVSFDWRLYRHDIAGSIAHAAALARAGIINADERQKIEDELRAIEKEIESGKFAWERSLEDVHMNIEAARRTQPQRSGRARSSSLCESGDCRNRGSSSLVADRIA